MLLNVYLTVTLSYVFVSKATSMLMSMITDKTRNTTYRNNATLEDELVSEFMSFLSARPNTDQMRMVDVLDKLSDRKRKEDNVRITQAIFLSRARARQKLRDKNRIKNSL